MQLLQTAPGRATPCAYPRLAYGGRSLALLAGLWLLGGASAVAASPLASTPGSPGAATEDDDAGDRDRRREASDSEKDEAPAPKSPQEIWGTGKRHEYVWIEGRRNVGRTRFRIEPHPTEDGRRVVHVDFRYEKDTTRIDLRRNYEFTLDWRLVRFDSQFDMRGLKFARSSTSDVGWVDGNQLVTEVVHNGDEENLNRIELPFDRSTLAMFTHAIEFWAIHAPRILPPKEEPVRIAFPYFGRVYEVSLSEKGREKLRHDEKFFETTHYAFVSKNKQLQGELWVDETGRLLKYRQGKLTIMLQAPQDSSKEGSREPKPSGDNGK